MSLRGQFNRVALLSVLTAALYIGGSTVSNRFAEPRKHKKEAPTPPAPEDFSLTVHEKSRITIDHPSGTVETRQGGTMAWRNNNPGNIVYGDMAERMGAIGNNHGMAVFPDYETGCEASESLLLSPSYIDLTVHQAIKRRSPPVENDTRRLQKIICERCGLTGKEKIRNLTKEKLESFLEAIQHTEGWKKGKVFVKKATTLPVKKKPDNAHKPS